MNSIKKINLTFIESWKYEYTTDNKEMDIKVDNTKNRSKREKNSDNSKLNSIGCIDLVIGLPKTEEVFISKHSTLCSVFDN